MGSRCTGFSSCGTWAQQCVAHGLSYSVALGSSRTRDRTPVPCIGRRILNHCAMREAPLPHLWCHPNASRVWEKNVSHPRGSWMETKVTKSEREGSSRTGRNVGGENCRGKYLHFLVHRAHPLTSWSSYYWLSDNESIMERVDWLAFESHLWHIHTYWPNFDKPTVIFFFSFSIQLSDKNHYFLTSPGLDPDTMNLRGTSSILQVECFGRGPQLENWSSLTMQGIS